MAGRNGFTALTPCISYEATFDTYLELGPNQFLTNDGAQFTFKKKIKKKLEASGERRFEFPRDGMDCEHRQNINQKKQKHLNLSR